MSNKKIKSELYSCLVMLESFRDSVAKVLDTSDDCVSAISLTGKYNLLREILSKNLTTEQMKFIPDVQNVPIVKGLNFDLTLRMFRSKIEDLLTASNMSIAYIRSLWGSMEMELEDKRKELELEKKENEAMRKFLKKSIEAVGQLPEVQRSKAVAEWKKAHREIEGHSGERTGLGGYFEGLAKKRKAKPTRSKTPR